MPQTFGRCFATIFLVLLCFGYSKVSATHIVGGECTYKHIGSYLGSEKYEVTLSIYEDCLNGTASAIEADNLGIFAIFDQRGDTLLIDSFLYSTFLTVPANFSNLCVLNPPSVCLQKKIFIHDYILPHNSSGYIVAYQRCCRNGAVMNIVSPGNSGSTYFCSIPPFDSVAVNNSAVFKNYPPQIICINEPINYDHSAVDADGDSLSYEFTAALTGGNSVNQPKPIPSPPPYDSVTYISPYTPKHPMTGAPPITIDPLTGYISGTPNQIGRYLVTVSCHEWRGGKIINTTRREFQFVVTQCSKSVIACIPTITSDPNTFSINCMDSIVNFNNCSTGGTSYHWEFGVPGQPFDTSDAFAPVFKYPDTGVFMVKLIVNPNSTCSDSTWKYVKMYGHYSADFSYSGTPCPGLPIDFTDLSYSLIKPINSWNWSFGDGTTSTLQNPAHTFPSGGTFNVTLVSQNIKGCTDTFIRQVLIEQFQPFAGNDTIIVKGEDVQFNASGGTSYFWSPSENLNNTNISNPLGYYPDTGTYTYIVNVTSPFGCTGADTIKVQVVNQAAFFMPTAFSPNGDGKNDVFRPIAIGYRSLNYFRIFNRWGQNVYATQSFETGWDGTFKGKAAELGTYYWEISYIDRSGKNGTLKGDVTLVR